MAGKVVGRPHDHFPRVRPDLDHVPRRRRAAGQAAALAHGVAGKAGVLADHLAGRRHQRARLQRRRIGRKVPFEHAEVVVVRHEADLHRLRLLGGPEAEAARVRARLRLRHFPDRRQHPLDDGTVDPPEEVALVLRRVEAAVEGAVARDRVMAGRDVVASERIGVCEEVPELGERVASDARNRSAAAAVLGHEVLDDVQREAVLEVEDVVRNPDRVGHVAGVVDRVERTAGTIGDIVAVAEELHRGAHHVVALLHEARGRHRAVYAPRHGDQHLPTHGRALRRACAPCRRPPGTRRRHERCRHGWWRGRS